MKEYRSMEAYKVSFNANEQVAAACAIWDNGKYSNDSLQGGCLGEVVGTGHYGTTQMPSPLDFMNNACFVDASGNMVDGSGSVQYSS